MYILKGSILLDFDTTMENICAIKLKNKAYDLVDILNKSTQNIMKDFEKKTGLTEISLNKLLLIPEYKNQLKEALSEILAPYEIGVFLTTLAEKNLNICSDSKTFEVEVLVEY